MLSDVMYTVQLSHRSVSVVPVKKMRRGALAYYNNQRYPVNGNEATLLH